MLTQDSKVQAVIDRCYASVLDDRAWSDTLTAVADLVSGCGTTLFSMSPLTGKVYRNDVARLDVEMARSYYADWTTRDIRIPAGNATPVGIPMTEETLLPGSVRRRSEFFNEFLKPHDLPHCLAAWLHRSPDRAVVLAIQGTRHRGVFSADECNRVSAVLPHLTRALELKDRLATAAGAGQSLLSIIDLLSFGVVIIDEQGRLLEVSCVAGEILDRADGLYADNNRIAFRRRQDGDALRRMMNPAPSAAFASTALRIRRTGAAKALSLMVLPIAGLEVPWLTANRRWLIAIIDPDRGLTPAPDRVAQELRLTAGQARVACLLATGISIAHISDVLNVSINTVRTHLKHIYAQSGTRGQSDLVRRVLSVPVINVTEVANNIAKRGCR